MNNTNELIFVNNILTSKTTIRKAAKQLGLRRDDLIKRIKEILKDDVENIKKLDLIIIINKIIYDNFKIKDAAKIMNMTPKELDKKIIAHIQENKNKFERYNHIKKEQISKLEGI